VYTFILHNKHFTDENDNLNESLYKWRAQRNSTPSRWNYLSSGLYIHMT